MKKLGALLVALSLTAGAVAQDESEGRKSFFARLNEKNILNHLDVGASVGTMGLGIDVAVPVGDYVRVRAGYNYMPGFNIKTDVGTGHNVTSFIDKIGKIDKKFAERGADINLPSFDKERELIEAYKDGRLQAKNEITVNMKPNLHQFKFLVDVMPFKNNKHWSFTAGFFAGPAYVGKANTLEQDRMLLKAVNLYNSRYYRDYILNDMKIKYVDQYGTHLVGYDDLTDIVKKNGLGGFTLGRFKDDGRKAVMVPDEEGKACADMKISKFRPYLGFGYNTSLSKDKKWNLNVDAGIMFLCGAPKVYVDNVYKIDDSPLRFDENGNYVSGIGVDKYDNYYGELVRWNQDEWEYELVNAEKLDKVDIVHDLRDVPGKVGNMTQTASRFKVYPKASVTFSYRIF